MQQMARVGDEDTCAINHSGKTVVFLSYNKNRRCSILGVRLLSTSL